MELWSTGRSGIWCQQQLSRRWSVSQRAARRYLEIARKRLREQAPAQDPEAARDEIRRKLEAAYEMAVEERDAKGMVTAAQRLGELAGVLGTRKVELSGGLNVNVDTASLAQRIAALSAAGVEAALSDAAPAGAQATLASGAAGDRSGNGTSGASAA